MGPDPPYKSPLICGFLQQLNQIFFSLDNVQTVSPIQRCLRLRLLALLPHPRGYIWWLILKSIHSIDQVYTKSQYTPYLTQLNSQLRFQEGTTNQFDFYQKFSVNFGYLEEDIPIFTQSEPKLLLSEMLTYSCFHSIIFNHNNKMKILILYIYKPTPYMINQDLIKLYTKISLATVLCIVIIHKIIQTFKNRNENEVEEQSAADKPIKKTDGKNDDHVSQSQSLFSHHTDMEDK
ncbi:Hypothetical_protein [Hexamita inflata]|uniref:Hypothetical_protein n=1 Tax=Hexamita inflata TaxID=28002 RepID=A0AA86NN41_9EUKA|nr:Hypothetical protein HINF_LOCUS10690 [Hexamita inflata]